MMRFLAGVASALLLMAAAMVWWRGTGHAEDPLPPPAVAASAASISPVAAGPVAMPPQAPDRTREEKRFARYDKDKNGAVGREEYLAARRKAFAKLDRDKDGKLAFEEYAVRTAEKFARADKDRSGVLTAAEFAATRVIRKQPRNCPPAPSEGTGSQADE